MPDDDAKLLKALLAAAHARRRATRAVTTAYRLVDDVEDGFPGLTVDVYGGYAVISIYEASAVSAVVPLARALVPAYAQGVYVKHHARSDLRHRSRDDIAPATPVAGETAPDELVVEEHGARFAVWLADGLSTGLFTDQRDNRRAVRAASRGVRVLNLFAYTCSFTVAAALGGAIETVSVDLSNRALERGRANLVRNELSLDGHRFLHEDALAYLSRVARRGERFGIVVVDPPSFGTRGKKTFSVERDYGELARLAASVLAPGGRLLAVTNHRKTTTARLRELVVDAVHRVGTSIASLEELAVSSDHRHRENGVSPTKSILVTLS